MPEPVVGGRLQPSDGRVPSTRTLSGCAAGRWAMTTQTHGSATMQGCATRASVAMLDACFGTTWAWQPFTKVVAT